MGYGQGIGVILDLHKSKINSLHNRPDYFRRAFQKYSFAVTTTNLNTHYFIDQHNLVQNS